MARTYIHISWGIGYGLWKAEVKYNPLFRKAGGGGGRTIYTIRVVRVATSLYIYYILIYVAK